MTKKITGIILAGGKSSRMGDDKSFLLCSGKPLIEIVVDKLLHFFKDLIIVTNKPHLYKKYGIRTEPDILKGRGPLGGIYTGLITSLDKYNFIVACDMPFLNQDLIQYMLERINGYDIIIPERSSKLEPLCAVYSKNCLKPIQDELSRNNLKITDFFKQVKVRTITEKETARLNSDKPSFVNINTPQDYRKWCQAAKK